MALSIAHYQFLIFNSSFLKVKYLDPRADLSLKRVFGEHPDLVMSFLNALLPFETPEEEIKSVEYLDYDMVPINIFLEDNVVNVRCEDQLGRQFTVEMQMMWTPAYKLRVSFDNEGRIQIGRVDSVWPNVGAAGRGGSNPTLGDACASQPIYSLNLLDDCFFLEDSDRYYHDCRIVENQETKEVIEGMRFVFVELSKFTPKNFSGKEMMALWLRYLTEINGKTRRISQDLLDNPDIRKAVSLLEMFNFTDNQLAAYDRFWDTVSTERTLIMSSHKEGQKEGEAIGEKKERLKNARGMKAEGIPSGLISKITGLSLQEIEAL